MKTIKIACPACGQHIEGPPDLAGQPLVCPSCQTGFVPPARRKFPPFTPQAKSTLTAFAGILCFIAGSAFFLAWPPVGGILCMTGCVIFTAGVFELVWNCSPLTKAKLVIGLGVVILAYNWLFSPSLPGILVGGFISLLGLGWLAIQRLPAGPAK
jgi:hypothetical protein